MQSQERSVLEKALDRAITKLSRYAPSIGDRIYHWVDKDKVEWTDGWGWTDGFWPGLLWLVCQATGDTKWAELANRSRHRFKERLAAHETHTHDMGFLYTLSAVSAHASAGDTEAREMAIAAARSLAARYNPFGRFIRAWNEWVSDNEVQRREKHGKSIIDTMMNLSLLWWASRETGNTSFSEIAHEHARTTRRYFFRPDGSTIHTFIFDHLTGQPLVGRTHQGYSDNSCWARGHAWALYGYALAYRHTKEPQYLQTARFAANYLINSLPQDGVPPWDFDAPSPVPDTSAGCVASCGLLELADHVAPEECHRYRDLAVKTLIQVGQRFLQPQEHLGLVKGGVSNMPRDYGVDVSLIYGDYFYIEGLLKALGLHKTSFWCP